MALVEVRDLSYRYADGTRALRHVTFAIDDGECVGLVGPNGAGKSTLLWHLNGLLPECSGHRAGSGRAGEGRHSGQSLASAHRADDAHVDAARTGTPNGCAVHVVGLPMSDENLPAIRRAVGLVFQDPDDQLFCPSVREDVAFGPLNLGLPHDEVRHRVAEALAAVGLGAGGSADVSARLPHHLSVGERKRVCLAGVLACQPRVLALDEPTANLDPRARRQLMAVLAEFPCAKIIASHDLEMILEMCSRVILLDEGEVRADGSTAEILRDEPLLVAHGLELPHSLRSHA
jgi:energy-coupling factor transporter ATP-binding protein EcfA2